MVGQVKRIELSYPRADLRNPDSKVLDLQGDQLVWWYGRIQQNPIARSIPLVEVFFRRLYNDIPGPHTSAVVPLSSLPHYRVGTIWRDGKCISDTELLVKEFSVDFSPDQWCFTSREELYSKNTPHIFPDIEYPLKYSRDRCRLINFKLPNKQNVLIPCTEYFVRAYARSMDVCRALVILKRSDVMSVFFDCFLRDEYAWLVKPSHKMLESDAVFLAHLLYDDYTEDRVKYINAQFTSRRPSDKVFLEAAPWFVGTGKILCRGKWINQGNTFLCLDLQASSQPQGQTIKWLRLKFDSSNGDDGGRLMMPKPVRTAEAEEFLSEESYAEPDGHAETTIVKAPPFGILGKERRVEKIKQLIETDRGKLGPRPADAETHSSGDGVGAGKNIGKLEHAADAELESLGFLQDIWNAFRSIMIANPERVTKVEWYTPPKFSNQGSPRMILLEPVARSLHKDKGIRDARAWTYLNRETAKRRGVMVLRIKVDGINYFCFEIQRDEAADKKKKIPGYAGVLMKSHITTPEDFEEFVKTVCSKVRYVLGRFKHMRNLFPYEAKIFNHHPRDQNVLHRNRLINVFKELGVKLH